MFTLKNMQVMDDLETKLAQEGLLHEQRDTRIQTLAFKYGVPYQFARHTYVVRYSIDQESNPDRDYLLKATERDLRRSLFYREEGSQGDYS